MEKLKNLVKKALSAQAARYFISSCAAFAVDYLLLLILDKMLSGMTFLSMELAAVIAFIVSSQINFWINRRWVFRSEKSVWPEMSGYYALSLFSFSVKIFVLVEIQVRLLRIPLAVARPVAEASMFVFNFLVQKKLIFRIKKHARRQ